MLSDNKAFGYLIEYNESKQIIKTNKIEMNKRNETNSSQKFFKDYCWFNWCRKFFKSNIRSNLAKIKFKIKTIVTSKGISGTLLARKLKAEISSTSVDDIFKDDAINTAIITTQHNFYMQI